MTKRSWQDVIEFFKNKFQKEADTKSVLFIIGLRELGTLGEENFTKEEKQDLMNIALAKILSYDGYFVMKARDADGWPIWQQKKPMPKLSAKEQEEFIKQSIVHYFEQEKILE